MAAAVAAPMSPEVQAALAAMQPLLDLSKPVDVTLLDNVVNASYNIADSAAAARHAANMVLTKLLDEPAAWKIVPTVLETSQNAKTKFFVTKVLENTVRFRWGLIPATERNGIRQYVVQKIIAFTSDAEVAKKERLFVGKLNVVLVQLLKREWPHNWPTFISEIVGASKKSEVLCTNNMEILKLLSEEVFDFSKNEMTSAKVQELKASLNKEFAQIFDLCQYILTYSESPALLNVTLETLLRFISWIPMGYMFETKLVENLCMKFFRAPLFRCGALACLTEIAALGNGGKEAYDRVFEQLYLGVITILQSHIPPNVNIASGYDDGSDEEQMLIQRLSLFFSSVFKAHLKLLEQPAFQQGLLVGLQYLVNISNVDEPEIFKICLDCWCAIVNNLYDTECKFNPGATAGLNVGSVSAGLSAALKAGANATGSVSARKALYGSILSQVRMVMINHMVKPEEVLIKEDENGDIVRVATKDTEALGQYKIMKETLVKLTHLDYEDTENIMLGKLSKQVSGAEWSWSGLNTLCWAIGSISGAMSETDEKRFLVTVIKDLLGLCELKRGKNNKAVVASNIMYVVGQYPRFLRQHWKFLRTVVLKLFEFMHEKHPGVQDMACDTFLKIAQKLKRKFVMLQAGEQVAFIDEMCENLPVTIVDLEMHQIHTFYEAAGHMISAHPDAGHRAALLRRLMSMPNTLWSRIMGSAAQQLEQLKNPDTVREVQRILRTYVRTCQSVGPSFITQMGLIYLDMLNVYKAYSEFISYTVSSNGPNSMTLSLIKLMSSVKRETLSLIKTFVQQKADDIQVIATKFIPPLLDPVLGDYHRNIPQAREADVLQLLAAIVTRLKGLVAAEVPRMMEAVFECTLNMINKNYTDFPDHRHGFYKFLEAVNQHCFAALFSIPPTHQKLVIQAIMWGVRHSEPTICEMGLSILQTLLDNVHNTMSKDAAQPFWQQYYVPILQDILFVLTDRLHKFAFRQHTIILRQLCIMLPTGSITVPLFDQTAVPAGTTNEMYIKQHIANLLAGAFANLTAGQVKDFVNGLFTASMDVNAYKTHLRDFLIEMREFKAEDNRALYREEAEAAAAEAKKAELARISAIPGLAPVNDFDDDL